MKPLPRIFGLIFLLSSASSLADSVTVLSNLNATFQIVPNVRATFEGEIFGTGINAYATGDMPGGWFSIAPSIHYLPGSAASGSTQVFFESISKTVGSDGSDYTFSMIDAGSYVFPTDGRNFTVNLPAALESFYLNGYCDDTRCYPALLLNFKPGDLRLSYTYSNGQYYPASGSFSTSTVPEPATLGLVAFGAAAVAYRKRKQKADESRAS